MRDALTLHLNLDGHPAVGLLFLLAIAVLNVYKPAGVTSYGWRKQREQRNGLERSNTARYVIGLAHASWY